jgi:hypothetical protein
VSNMEIEQHIPTQIKARLDKERVFVQSYGTIRPILTTSDNVGRRFVAVGDNRILGSDRWKTFPDFLFFYLWETMGHEWLTIQKAASDSDLHTLIHWYRAFRRFAKKQVPGSDGIFESKMNGPTAALLSFAYDLFTVDNNLSLPPRLLNRLRNADQFQGARYELFAICALIRSGFKIVLVDDAAPGSTRPELFATHMRTGVTHAVECKSKHRKGVLGRPGTPVPNDQVRLGNIRRLLSGAVTKDVDGPLVVFFDVNLPPEQARHILGFQDPMRLSNTIDTLPQASTGADLFNFVLFTNHPHHYGREESKNPERIYSGIISHKPKYPVPQFRLVYDDIVAGALKYGRVPQSFEEL